MITFARTTVAALVLSVLSACAGGTPAPATPSAPVALPGTRWKLVTLGGKLDGRVVEFKAEGDGVVGLLIEPGLKLRDVPGVRQGLRMFVLQRSTSNPNDYSGTFENLDSQGTFITKQVTVSVGAETLSWTLETATWERAP